MSVPSSSNKMISKQLKVKASEFLSSRKHANNLVDIIQYFEKSINTSASVISTLLTIENVFTELLKRGEMKISIEPMKPKDTSPEVQYREWLQERYKEAMQCIVSCFASEKEADGTQALATAMKLLGWEGKHPIEAYTDVYSFPVNQLRLILESILSSENSTSHLTTRFQEFACYQDVLYYSWKLLPGLTPKGSTQNDTFIKNYLDLVDTISLPKDYELEKPNLLCGTETNEMKLDYPALRKCLNKCWACLMLWQLSETTHRQLLIVLLEKILPHLDKPVLLTDFLMDSLDVGGPISLLALQGVFTLIQQHNLTYPNIYEKLYSMFEPEIFHTKFKARLFYLADIFLSSSHLPENLVAAFVKRLARLSLIAPPQDIVIILYFIGNLIIRHQGLKQLICHPSGGEVNSDPYIMDERDPTKSFAIESSLWEVAALQSHALPSIATAAKFIAHPLPVAEWDLANVLEVTEDDIFDKELAKKSKEFHVTFERPTSMFLPKTDKLMQYWKLF